MIDATASISKEIAMAEVPPDDVHEKFGHIQARPVSWVVVFLVCAGFLVGGIGLIAATPWVFWVGIGAVAVGTVLGGVTHAMADMTARAHGSGHPKQPIDSEATTH
jgi:hypothetical protein